MSQNFLNNDRYTLIIGGFILNPGEAKQKKNILIHNSKIVDITDNIPDETENFEIIDAKGGIISPGLIDQHIHGGYGCDFNNADVETIVNFLSNLPKHGITSICPTIMTDAPEKIRTQIEKITQAKRKLPVSSTKILGINLEGPFLNPEYKGAHNKNLFLEPSIKNYREIESDEIKITTIAPELDRGNELAQYLLKRGIIPSAGHSAADAAQVNSAFAAGLNHITHIFNAMRPLHHREPGIIGGSLSNDEVYVEVIADHNHLHADIVSLILKAKPEDKVIFISDSLPLNQSSEESAVFGGQKIYKRGEIAVNEEGNFAGSLIFLDTQVRKNLNITDFSKLLKYCSENPAKNLKLKDLGYISKGKTADLVIWTENKAEIQAVIINGEISFSKHKSN